MADDMDAIRELRIHYTDYREDYDLLTGKVIGEGTYGYTRLVKKKGGGGVYAMKTIITKHLGDVLSEIWIVSRFRYVHIISVYDVYFRYLMDEERWRVDIVMEVGRPIVLKNLNVIQKWKLIHQLITVLAFLQGNGVIYGDIKINNLLLSYYGELKLIDLGMYYKIGYGEPPVTQSFSDLGGYHKQKMPIYKSKTDRSPRTITYDVTKNAMWALGMTIIEMITEKGIDYSRQIDGVPTVIYEITDNPNYLDKLLSGYENWKPIIRRLLLSPPENFSEILWDPFFVDLTKKYTEIASTARVIEPILPFPYMKESKSLDKCMEYIYKNELIIPPESKCMAVMYFMYYLLPLGLGLDSSVYKDLILPEEILEHHMELTYVNVEHYPNVHIPSIKNIISKQKKMLLGLPVFSLACLVFGQAVISTEYEVLNIYYIKELIDGVMGKVCPNTDIVLAGIIYYIEGLISYTNGNFLLPNPYFKLVSQNINIGENLFEMSSSYKKYTELMYTYINLRPMVSHVSPKSLPDLSELNLL